MALTFNVNAGPLSQVGIEILDLKSAYQLPSGAWGWWKSRERTESLTSILAINGAALAQTSSFNLDNYKRVRHDYGNIRGIVVQSELAQTVTLPKASTAVPEDPGQACLRALAAAILCLYGTETTTDLLRDLIPSYLLQRDLDDATISFDGPLLASLRDWVTSIAIEEDSDSTRDFLLRELTTKESNLTGIPMQELMNADLGQPSEIPFVLGVLRWTLTPQSQRKIQKYPTRSLRAWSMASCLSSLGFGVFPASYIAHDAADYDANAVEADEYAGNRNRPSKPPQFRPRITHMGGIPRLAFRHVSQAAELEHIWNTAFWQARTQYPTLANAKSTIADPKLFTSPSTYLKIPLARSSVETVPDVHWNLCALLNSNIRENNIAPLCSFLMTTFAPGTETDVDWDLGGIASALEVDYRHDQPNEKDHLPLMRNSYILKAIVLGTIYGICSNAIVSPGIKPGDDSAAILDIDVAVPEDIARHSCTDLMCTWASELGSACFLDQPKSLTSSFSHNKWYNLIFQVLIGWEAIPPVKVDHFRTPYGVQANGLALLSDFAVRPNIAAKTFTLFHLFRGGFINFPVDEHGTVRCSDARDHMKPFSRNIDASDTKDISFAKQGILSSSHDKLRADIEPYWESDPRSIILRRQRDNNYTGHQLDKRELNGPTKKAM
ncbi:hypothetical protein BDV95DRAFT_662417 [Massariosphaeria phaeospora]|uniref:Uncharacterized protein n=1 Tax=Massariosphaeria phaeospora TaxID=100035 RepID=A0A7C8M9H6_9PLEO|nr:hypothetical protein BDV95DRAFT_662417 [Massariosphaeria phaeospora]